MEFVNKNKTTIPITFKFAYNSDAFATDIIARFEKNRWKSALALTPQVTEVTATRSTS